MCASILLSVKWNIGRISKVPFEIRKARSTTHSPWYWFITRSVSKSVLVIYPFNPTSTFPPQNFPVIQHLQFLHIYCGYYKFSNSTELG